jgi:hypothetical protein
LFWGIITNAMHKNLPTSGTKMASNCDVHSPPCSFKYLTGQSWILKTTFLLQDKKIATQLVNLWYHYIFSSLDLLPSHGLCHLSWYSLDRAPNTFTMLFPPVAKTLFNLVEVLERLTTSFWTMDTPLSELLYQVLFIASWSI